MESYAELFQSFPLATLVLDAGRQVMEMNAEARMEFAGVPVHSVVQDLAAEIEQYEGAGEAHMTFEKELAAPEGGLPKYYRIRLSSVRGAGDSRRTIVTFTCITERIRLKEDLIRLAHVVESSDDAIFSITLNRVVTSWNSGAERIYGVPVQGALGKPLARILPQSMEAEFDAIMRSLAEGRSSRHEMVHRHSDGHIFPVSATFSPVLTCGKTTSVSIVARDITSRKLAERELQKSHDRLQGLLNDVVQSLSVVQEKRDLYTAGHQQRVAEISCALARELGLPGAEVETLRIAALLHDIGKVSIPMAILAKPTTLDQPEMAIMQRHPEVGGDILFNIAFPGPVGEIILQHHERMDGSGYPRGLSGQDIVFGARIIAVADTLEAMSAHRPYRPALGLDAALGEIRAQSGTRYDPRVCAALFTLVERQCITFAGGHIRVASGGDIGSGVLPQAI